MTENSVVTIFRPDDGPCGLHCLGTFPAWVFREEGIKNSGGGTFYDDSFDVRVKTLYIESILPGDLIFFGRAMAGSVEAHECRQIAAVRLNSMGSFPHWHLNSKYRYR